MNARSWPWQSMSLRLRLNLLIASLMLFLLLLLNGIDILGTRAAVREEIVASHRVATQLVREVLEQYGRGGPQQLQQLQQFLDRLGRVRANDMELFSAGGQLLYRSPPSTYKQGRDAPRWYAWLVTPQEDMVELPVQGGTMRIRSNPSRAVLDGWDDMQLQMLGSLLLLLAVNAVLFGVLGRWLAPFEQIRQSLERVGHGEYAPRLPTFHGREAVAMADTVTRMADALAQRRSAEVQAAQAEARLAAEREFVRQLQQRVEAERRELASTLHDELGQQLTAVRTLSHTLVRYSTQGDVAVQRAGALLQRTTDEMYDAMHRMLPRLRPAALDRLGLFDAVADLLAGLRQQNPDIDWQLQADARLREHEPDHALGLDEPLQTAAYRLLQEALNNVVKHAQASQVRVELVLEPQAEPALLWLRIVDNGVGLAQPSSVSGRYGLYGMAERARELGGSLQLLPTAGGGLTVEARLPLPG